MFPQRQARVTVLESLERRVKQFRSVEDSWPFRMPHEPIDLDALIEDAAGAGVLRADALKARTILRLEWTAGDTWELWTLTLPSGLHLYCDTDGHETRVLASARRGNASEADGFFLERLAESRGVLFGIEMAGAPPDRVKSSIGDREFLADVFVELLEETDAESVLRARCSVLGAGAGAGAQGADFRSVVVAWLDEVLSAPPGGRRQPRVRDEDPTAL
jgi:hypothetical protein